MPRKKIIKAPLTDQEKHMAAIDALIPLAKAYADKAVPVAAYKQKGRDCDKWNQTFFQRMNRLAVEAGLRVA